jgi:hypothetical protein
MFLSAGYKSCSSYHFLPFGRLSDRPGLDLNLIEFSASQFTLAQCPPSFTATDLYKNSPNTCLVIHLYLPSCKSCVICFPNLCCLDDKKAAQIFWQPIM